MPDDASAVPTATQGRFRRRLFVLVALGIIGAVTGVLLGLAKGEPDGHREEHPCPKAARADSLLTSHVFSENHLMRVESTLQVTLTDTTPPEPAWPTMNSGESGLAPFIRCFLPNEWLNELQSVDWADGKLVAKFSLTPVMAPRTDNQSFGRPMIFVDLGMGDSKLIVDLCGAPVATTAGPIVTGTSSPSSPRLVCREGSTMKTEITVDRSPGDQPWQSAEPFPRYVDVTDTAVTYHWKFSGPPQPVTVGLSMPASGVVLNYLRGSADFRVLLEGTHWQLLLRTPDLAGLISVLAAIAAGLIAVQRARQRLRVIALIAAVALVLPTRVLIDQIQFGEFAPLGNCAKAIVGWWLVTVAVAMCRRIVVAASVAALTGLACVVVVLRGSFSSARAVDWLLVLGAGAFLVLVTVGLFAMFQQLMALFRLREDEHSDHRARAILRGAAVFVVACALVAPLGEALRGGFGWSSVREIALNSLSYAADIAGPLWQLAPLLVVALVASEILVGQRILDGPESAYPLAFMVALAAPVLAAPVSDDRSFIVILPLWLAQLTVLWLGFRVWLARRDADSDAEVSTLSRAELLVAVGGAPAAASAGPGAAAAPDTESTINRRAAGEALLLRGSRDGRIANAKSAASLAGYLAVIPVVYFAWTTLGELGKHLEQGVGPLFIFTAILAEAARWTVVGFVFGYLYPLLPGRIGPIKALWFAGLWALGGLASAAVARGLNLDLSQPVLYRSAQFALFVIVLAVLMDIGAIRSAGGSVLDLKKTYALQNYSEITAAVAPALVLTLTLTQQVLAGSGFDVAKTFLSGIPGLL